MRSHAPQTGPGFNATRGAGRGFTLMESIVGVVLLAVSLPPLIWALGESRRTAAGPAQADVAYWLATERLEDIVADRSTAGRGFGYLSPEHYPDESAVAGFPGYSRAVEFVPADPALGGVEVRVTVTWVDGRGRAQTLRAVSLLAEKLR
ncbi:MAG: type II secretion system protein [Leptolyngbya sp. PLA1]|nr:type II secretion system protein [Leptolyngbya sp. PLA1]